MKCPYCSGIESRVLDSRPSDDYTSIRRRREYLECKQRFTTFEKIDSVPLIVIKKSGQRQVFDKNKILNGIIKSCEKRPVSLEQMTKIANDVEKAVMQLSLKEIPSEKIGEEIMPRLKDVDEVAYVRFASVYKEFKDINTFMEELKTIMKGKEE